MHLNFNFLLYTDFCNKIPLTQWYKPIKMYSLDVKETMSKIKASAT